MLIPQRDFRILSICQKTPITVPITVIYSEYNEDWGARSLSKGNQNAY